MDADLMEALRTVVGICNEYLEPDGANHNHWKDALEAAKHEKGCMGNSAVNLHLTQALMEIRDQLEAHIPIE